jgi:Abortive infection C-terminus
MSRQIPIAVIATVSDALGKRYSHARLDHFMDLAGIERNPRDLEGLNKVEKVRVCLRIANQIKMDPLVALGKVIAEMMEVNGSGYASDENLEPERIKVRSALAEHGWKYEKDGRIVQSSATTLTRTVSDIIRERDFVGLQTEFDRIYENLESDPAAAVTASCALLESLFKIYIDEKCLHMPADQSLKPLWKIVKNDLRLGPDTVNDNDLKTILTGLAAIVEGTGSLRTHKGSAHGQGKKAYKLKPRHARLAAHASFTLASFVLEAWAERDIAGL